MDSGIFRTDELWVEEDLRRTEAFGAELQMERLKGGSGD
jgi:hypothetical protein